MIKSIKAILAQDKEKFKVPRKVQDLIPIKNIWPDGIFKVGNKFSKSFRFSDINYLVASREDKESMFLTYSELLNSLDSGATTKITINNHRLNRSDFEESILMPMKQDRLDEYRKEYNDMLLDKATGANGITQEKHITITVAKKDIEEARAYFARIGADLTAHFANLGSKCVPLNAVERLRILHDFYRPGDEAAFSFDMNRKARLGHDFRDYICPDSIERAADHIKLGEKYARVLFLKDYASYIKDSMFSELTELNRNLMLSMLNHLKSEANIAYTENGAVTNASTMSDCLDLFAVIGALRAADDQEIIRRFVRAYAEDADIAMKILFFGRDVRGGLGERRVFRVIINWLAENRAESLRKNIELIPEFGRYDDLVSLIGTACEKDALRTICKQLEADLASDAEVSLLAKWLPSVNASNAETVRKAKRIARYLGMSDAEYRKTLVELRKKIRIIENHLREKDYSFDYAKQPSKAMFKYRKAFLRNDGERYNAFLEAVSSGEKQLHADNLAPYEIVRSALNANRWGFHADLTVGEKAALNASWASLPDFCDNRNALAVVDTSGSMYCYDNALPAAVALSLGLYFGERNTGIFHNHFIEFSAHPQLIEIKGKTFAERLEYLCTFNEVADTNVEAVFDLILDAAVRNNVPQEELPETLYLISDMEFNACVRNASVSNFASAKRRFAEHGYRLPQIVFWNVASRNSNQPVTKNEQGVALVSGCTPRLFSMVASGDLSPYSVMMDIIESERYAKISA